MKDKNFEDITIIIPTLNEQENIGELLDRIDKLYPGASVIVSDDGSTDQTPKIVQEFNKKNQKFMFYDRSNKAIKGLTASVIDARYLVKTPFLITIDGDLQHPPEKIEEITKELRRGIDVCAGTRKKDLSNWTLHRKIMSKIAILLGQIKLRIHGIKCTDPVSGFFGIKTELFNNIDEKNYEMEGYKVLFDTLKRVPSNSKVSEIYYFFGLRKTGKSKINKKHIWLYFKSLFK